MLVAVLTVKIDLPWANSLKDKRGEVKSLIMRLSGKFRVAVAESDFQDYYRTAQITIAYLAANKALGDSFAETIISYIEGTTDANVVEVSKEYR